MPANFPALEKLHPIDGVQIATTYAQIRTTPKDDFTLFALAEGSTCAATFTQNAFCAAPVTLSKQHLTQGTPRYWLVNAGNANAGTGAQGMQDAQTCCQTVAKQFSCAPEAVLPFSTGVIGQTLPVVQMLNAIPTLANNLAADRWLAAAQAIMTTDTKPKGVSIQFDLNGQTVTLTGIAKGAGMIKPNMATLLTYIATDAAIAQPLLQQALQQAVKHSFNRISVDGDTSTNDSCVIAATGRSGVIIVADSPAYNTFYCELEKLCVQLAQMIIRDAEGATKFITIQIEQGANEAECTTVAYTIAHSPLVKTAFFASDANWGRLLAAIGRAEVPNLIIDAVEIYLDDVCLVRQGGIDPHYTEARGAKVMAQTDITVRVVLGRGNAQTTLWTCDLSHDYVSINADYRT